MARSRARRVCAFSSLGLSVLVCCAGFCRPALSQGRGASDEKRPSRTSVILSTDVGNEIDDQWAIAYLLASPEFRVLGIVSANAPSVPAPSAHSTYLVLRNEVENRLGMKIHPPLLEGSSLPLSDISTPQPNRGTDFIVEESRKFGKDNRLVVLTIGAATDVASAILQDPTIVDRIRIVAMAFTNSSPAGGKEYNVQNDVKAWQVLFSSDVPLTIGPGDVCRADLALTFAQARQLLSGHGAIGGWLWADYQTWYYRIVKPLRVDDFSQPWMIWDIITLANLEGMTTDEVLPRPVLGDDLSLKSGSSGKTVAWITKVDSARMWSDFLRKIDDFQTRHAIEPDKDIVFISPR